MIWLVSLSYMKYIRYLLLPLFTFLALYSLTYIVIKTIDPSGATDFHSYWYAGQFVRQGIDPYYAFINNQNPEIPIYYFDGKISNDLPIAQKGLARVPANTAPMVELLTLFSFFSWPIAKILWMICNLIMILIIPFGIFELFPLLKNRSIIDKVIFTLIFIGLFGTRNIATNGQTSLMVFAAMLLAVLKEKNWVLSGLAFGFALSKYSLSLSLLFLFLIERKYRQIIIGFTFQTIAIVILSLITQQSFVNIIEESYKIFSLHIYQTGIQLTSIFPQNNYGSDFLFIVPFFFTLSILSLLLYSRVIRPALPMTPPIRQTLFSILILWTLLVAYHRAYDTFIVIFVIATIFEFLIYIGKNNNYLYVILLITNIISIIILTIPASGVSIIVPTINSEFLSMWINFHNHSITCILIILLICSMYILYKYKHNKLILN